MKKFIAIMMALVMMMAIAVPAFAEQNITGDASTTDAQSGKADVVTVVDDTDATYTVTYPAAFTFEWDDTTAQNANYTVTSQLPIGASLKVSVAADNGALMTSEVATDYSLTYTLTGGAEETFAEINNDETPVTPVEISIAQEQYDNAVPAEYRGTVTYTATYVAA